MKATVIRKLHSWSPCSTLSKSVDPIVSLASGRRGDQLQIWRKHAVAIFFTVSNFRAQIPFTNNQATIPSSSALRFLGDRRSNDLPIFSQALGIENWNVMSSSFFSPWTLVLRLSRALGVSGQNRSIFYVSTCKDTK